MSKPWQGPPMNRGLKCAAAVTLSSTYALCTAPNANATIVGSTYNFTTSVTGNTQISPLGGPTIHTDPANPGFCVGPPVACGAGSGVSGAFTLATVAPTLDRVMFAYCGAAGGAGPGSFPVAVGHFVATAHAPAPLPLRVLWRIVLRSGRL